MQLPKALQLFSEPTLLVLLDEHAARFMVAGGDALETLDGMAAPDERGANGAGGFTREETGRNDLRADAHGTPQKARFARDVGARIVSLVQQGHAAHLFLAAPPEMLHLVETALPEQIREKIRGRADKNLMQSTEMEAVTALLSRRTHSE